MNRVYRTLLLALTAGTLLAGCSATALIYDNLPWLVRGQVDERFDLNSAQEQQLKERIAELAAWHRREELPRYAELLRSLEDAFADGLTQAEIERFSASLRSARARLIEAAIPASTEFLLSVNRAQLEEFERTHRERMEEDRERLQLPPEEQAELRFEKTLDNLEDWFGDFDAAQREAIRELVTAFPDTYAGWLERREYQHRRFIELMSADPKPDQVEARLRDWWLSDSGGLPSAMLANRDRFWKSAFAFLLKVDGLLTAEQRTHALDRIRGYREDFVRLSKADHEAGRGNRS